ncbi:hypothetical protein N7603_05475 [Acholeplasma vituli]|uniref:NERD domain-containing protein n=1 Tax=Paracholeplasma vituli TaxID=69473 RepID=A0ABT2PVX0_9MOLU|nr:hypothetical protein [Paracholeplasma vituli]MCU0105103.1 hypothetical protein [Paracholeplasma vituli]
MKSYRFILDSIRNSIASMDLFKYKRSDLLYILNSEIDKLAIESFKNTFNSSKEDNTVNSLMVSHIPYSYRQILKFIYEFSDEDGLECDYELIVKGFQDLFPGMFMYYNEIRNRIDRHEIGVLELKYDENSKTLTEIQTDLSRRHFKRALEINNVGNHSIDHKMAYSWYLNKNKSMIKNFKYMHYFRQHINRDDYEELNKIILLDSEIKYDIDFGDFLYKDLINVCAALTYIALFKQLSNFANEQIYKNDTKCCYIEKYDIFIKHISEITRINEETVRLIIGYMIYDSLYHRTKITLLQHLIRIDDNIIFSPYVLVPAELPKKFYRVINDFSKEKYEKVFSFVAHTKEYSMIEEIKTNYLNHSTLVVMTNVKLKKPNSKIVNAEYDIILYDSSLKTVYLCECKWFYVSDGESESKKVTRKIQDSINYRLKQDTIVRNNIEHFNLEVFNGNVEIEKVESLIISYTDMGDDYINYKIPVIDFVTFKLLSDKYNFDIHSVYDSIKEQKFLNEIDVESITSEFHYCGFNFVFQRMAVHH